MADNKTSIIISAVDQTGAALKSAEAGLAGLGAQAGRVSGILSGFAALAGATAFGGIIKGAIDAADELDDLAQKSGATVESLSAMKGVAKIAGADMEQVAGGLAKLSKNMVEAANGSGDAAKVLTALGVSVTDNAGKMKSTDQVMVEFAKSLQNVGSGTEKVAAAQMVLGKSGAQLLPFLNDLAAAGELQVKVTAEQAAAAANLNDNLTRLSSVHKAWANTVAMEVVPVADVFVKALLETAQGANGTKKAVEDMARDGTLKQWAQDAAKAAGFVVDALDGVSRVTQGVGLSLGAMAAAGAAVASGEFGRAREVMSLLVSDLDKLSQKELFSATLTKRMADLGTTSQAATPGVKSIAAALGDAGEKAAKAAQALADLRMETILRNAKEAAKELDTLAKAQEEYAKALYAGTEAIESQAQSAERELRYYGMTESAIQATIIARLEEARAIAAANGAYPEHLAYLDREIEARQRIATASSQKEFLDTNKRAAEASAREWEKFADDLNRSLTDALFRAFESGNGFGKSFADTLGNTLKAAVAKALINVAITTGSNALNTGINALLGTSAANNGAGTNYLGLASNASSVYNLANGTYATAGLAAYSQYQAGIPIAQWSLTNAAPVTTAVNTSGVAANGMANQAGTGAGSSLGGIATGVLAIIAGMYMSGEAWKNGYRPDGNWTKKDDPRTYELALRDGEYDINKALFGKDWAGSQLLAILTGSSLQKQMTEWVQSGIFGRERVTGSQISGTFSEAEMGFSGRSGVNMKKSGGLFSGSKEWTEWSDLPKEIDEIFDSLYRVTSNSFAMLGDVFGDSGLAEKINGFVFKYTDDGFETIQEQVQKMSEQLTTAIGKTLLPSIEGLAVTTEENGKKITETWNQTFQRVVIEANAVNAAFDLVGESLASLYGNNTDKILAASDAFVKLFGSIDAMTGAVNAYYENFYSSAEKQARAWEQIGKQFAALNVSTPTTREQFRALVEAQDLSTDAGQRTFAALMGLQGAFAALTPEIGNLTTAAEQAAAAAARTRAAAQETQAARIADYLDAERSSALAAQSAMLDSQASAAQSAADSARSIAQTFRQILDGLTDYRSSLLAGQGGALSAQAQYAAARQAFADVSSRARLGDATAAGNLRSVGDAFLAASRNVNGFGAYQADYGSVLGTVDSVIGVAERQIPIAEQQLTVAQAQLASLESIRASLTTAGEPTAESLPTIIANYQQASKDWNDWFANTAIGSTIEYDIGKTTRLSETMGLFTDLLGNAFTFSQSEGFYSLADKSKAFADSLLKNYGKWTGPSFAAGGYHSGGLRLVGEFGPELEFTGPSRILSATDTASLLGGAGLIDELRALRAEVSQLRAEAQAGQAAIAANTRKSASLLDKFDIDGLPEVRAA